MSHGHVLNLWTIYNNPADYPGKYVARRFVIDYGRSFATPDVIVNDSLEYLQEVMLDKGLTKLPRADSDEGHIVETWI